MEEIAKERIDKVYEEIKADASSGGYSLNPDVEFCGKLVRGLLMNESRYGYRSCPCRLALGIKEDDLDIICPCDYRDPDLSQYGCCYCALYVSKDVVDGKKKASSIPERRKLKGGNIQMDKAKEPISKINNSVLSYPVWRCKVCGYLCARDEAPEICPVCKAKKERFERFI